MHLYAFSLATVAVSLSLVRHRVKVLLILSLCLTPTRGEEFSGEAFLLASSVTNNGTSVALPSRLSTATEYLDYPGDFGSGKLFRLEMATLPLFGGLSQNLNGALSYALDQNTLINAFAQTVTTDEISVLPLLNGSAQDRLNDPTFRPRPCNGCAQLRDVVYSANINLVRKYDWEVPRIDISTRPIPVQFSFGATSKYFYEELEGGDYLAQNLNVDLGIAAKFFWGFDPITHLSDRNIKFQLNGFELLPTSQKSEFSSVQVYEKMSRRWHFSASWEEQLPDWSSTLAIGFTQKSEQGKIPAIGLEWGFKDLLFLRAGKDDEYISAGSSVAYRWASIHYAIRQHELGISFYQVSAQLQFH